MFLVAVVALAAVTVPLFGGRLGALVEVRLRHVGAIFAALGLEMAALELPRLADRLRAALLVVAYPYPVRAVSLAANWRLPGVPLIAVGAACNPGAVAANGGVMPASPTALAGAVLPVNAPGFHNSTPWPSRGWRSWATSVSFPPPGRSATSSASATCSSPSGSSGHCTASAGHGWPHPGPAEGSQRYTTTALPGQRRVPSRPARPRHTHDLRHTFDLAGGRRHPRPGDRRADGPRGHPPVLLDGRGHERDGVVYRHTTTPMEARILQALDRRLAEAIAVVEALG